MRAAAARLDDTDAFIRDYGLSLEEICARLYERHRNYIDVKKPATAIANLGKVLTAALELSSRGSFHEMTMRDLTAESGLSMGALYTYIRDKDGLLDMILDVVSDAVDRVLVEVPRSYCADPRARLRWVVRQHVRLTEAMHDWFAFAYMEAKAFSPAARERARKAELRTESLITAALEQGVSNGTFRKLDTEMTAALIKPLLQDWYLKRWKYRRRGVTPDSYADSVMTLVEQGLLADAG